MLRPPLIASIARRRRIVPRAVVTPGSPDYVHTRVGGAGATYFDANGILQTAAAGVVRNAHYIGTERTLLLELSRTNVALHNRDLTNAAWVKSNVTAAKDQVGIDGAANGASSITATANAGTVLQSVTLASSQRSQSAYVKRLVGTGAVEMTTDGGATWTAITVTAAYTRVRCPAQTVTNPQFGFRLAASGDSIAVDYVQNENGPAMTSPMLTGASSAARTSDSYYVPYAVPPIASTFYVRGYELGTVLLPASARLISVGTDADPRFFVSQLGGGGVYAAVHRNLAGSQVQSTLAAAPAYGQEVEVLATIAASGSVQITQSVAGGAPSTASASGALALESAWSGLRLYLNSGSGGTVGAFAFTHVIVAQGNLSLAQMRALAGV